MKNFLRTVCCKLDIHFFRSKEVLKHYAGIPVSRVTVDVCIFCGKIKGENKFLNE